MKKLMIPLILLAITATAQDCHYTEILNVQTQTTNILIRVNDGRGNSPWKLLAVHSDDASTSFQALAQQAFASRNGLMMRFPDDYNCATTDYGTKPIALRINKTS